MGGAAKASLAFLAGVIAGYALSILGYYVATSVGGVHDQDGGLALSVAFLIGPAVAFLSGLGAAFIVAHRVDT